MSDALTTFKPGRLREPTERPEPAMEKRMLATRTPEPVVVSSRKVCAAA
jgi:hypothetical protein